MWGGVGVSIGPWSYKTAGEQRGRGEREKCKTDNRQWKTGQVAHCPVVGCRFSILQCLGSGSVAQTPIGDTGAILTY